MTGKRWPLAALAATIVLGVFVATAAAAPTPPFDTNSQCLECHDVAGTGAFTKLDFSAASVDYNRCRACHVPVTPDYYHYHFEAACTNCHSMPYFRADYLPQVNTTFGWFARNDSLLEPPASLHGKHVNGTSWLAFDPVCSRCHAPAACTACHAANPDHIDHALPDYPAVTYSQTAGTGAYSASVTCVNDACHSRANAASTTFVPNCSSCHAARTQPHGYESVNHTATVGVTPDPGGKVCGDCHSMGLYPEHQRPTSSSRAAECAACHPSPRDSFVAWGTTCQQGGCHPGGSATEPHANQGAKHLPAAAGEICADCHPGDLATVHSAVTSSTDPSKSSCTLCHSTTAYPASNDCTVCHFTFDNHYDPVKHTSTWTLDNCNDAGCHSTRDLMGAHTEKNPAFECFDCHNSTRPEVIAAIAAGDTACGACHSGVTEDSGHRAIHWANPQLVEAGTSKYAYYTGSAPGGAYTTDCAICHTSNVVDEHLGIIDAETGNVIRAPRYDRFGNALSCASCHVSLDANVMNAIATGMTNCDACHVVHGPISQTHQSSFVDAPPVNCAGCHSEDLPAQHAGYSATTPSGRILVGCSMCHEYWEGTRGQQIEDAIAAGDTRCTACHGAAHPEFGSHTATSAPSLDCAECHETGSSTEVDVQGVHAGAALGPCAVCHGNPSRVPDITTKTAECASCHSSEGTDYHRGLPAKHTYSAMPAGCVTAGCHVSNVLPNAHDPYLANYPQYATTCQLCHANQDPGRIPPDATAACDSCHTVHGDLEVLHQAPDGDECVACHETVDVRDVHADSPRGACAVCHDNPAQVPVLPASTKCTNCHGTLTPPDPNHYDPVPHTASAQTGGCDQCHFMELKPEHFKPSSGPVSCVECHESKVDNLTGAWDKRCETQCHASKHGSQNAKHQSTRTECGGSGCHNINSVSAIHAGRPGGGCSTCHVSASQPATTTDCLSAGCHPTATPGHKESHNTSGYIDAGCYGCHFQYLDDEHVALGYQCATCHASASQTVKDAIASNDRLCLTCHPGSAHNARQAQEFAPGNASMHRVFSNLPGMRSSFLVNGQTYTMSLPAAASFLKPGYSTDTMISCRDCHAYSGTNGPHGAQMKVNIDPAYPNTFKVFGGGSSNTAQLSPNSPTGMSMRDSSSAPAGIICEKCHDLLNGSSWSNVVHKEHDDRGSEGGYCNHCHIAVPHGWGRPRMLGYSTDEAGYRTASDGLRRFSLKSYSPNSWQKSDCGAGCSSGRHPTSGSSWPNVFGGGATPPPGPTTGAVSGTVSNSSTGAGVSGASVSLTGGASSTTASNGTYTLPNVNAATYTMTVSATGYEPWSGSVTVAAGQVKTQNVALAPVPSGGGNLALGKYFWASRYESSNYSPAKAGDGDTSTYWLSNRDGRYDDRESLYVDLGQGYSVSRVMIKWNGSDYAREYRVYTSSNNSDWSQVYDTSSGSSGEQSISFSSRTARYVRVECRRSSSYRSTGYGISELEVYE